LLLRARICHIFTIETDLKVGHILLHRCRETLFPELTSQRMNGGRHGGGCGKERPRKILAPTKRQGNNKRYAL